MTWTKQYRRGPGHWPNIGGRGRCKPGIWGYAREPGVNLLAVVISGGAFFATAAGGGSLYAAAATSSTGRPNLYLVDRRRSQPCVITRVAQQPYKRTSNQHENSRVLLFKAKTQESLLTS